MPDKYFTPDASVLPSLKTAMGTEIPFAQLIAIDTNNLIAEFEHHAAWQATISYSFARASAATATLKRQVKRLEAALFFAYKVELEKAGAKPTKEAIYNSIALDEGMQQLEDQLGVLEEEESVLMHAMRSFHDRHDNLIQLGAYERSGMPKLLQRVGDA